MISVVIPSYNRCDTILKLLADVSAQQDVEFEVIVVDDCSPDDSVAQIREKFPLVRLFENEKNGGPCVTRNRAVREANGDLIVGLDSDVGFPDPHMLAKVQSAFDADPEATGFAFRIFTSDGATDDTPRWWHPLSIAENKERAFETDYFSGTAYAFRREEMLAAGGYPEVLYMHYEEVVLAYRIMDQGGKIVYNPELSAVHHADPTPRRSRIKTFFKPRNQVLLSNALLPVLEGNEVSCPAPWIWGVQFTQRWIHQRLLCCYAVGERTWRRVSHAPQAARTCYLVADRVPRTMKVLLIAPFYDRQTPGESWSTYKWVEGISEHCDTTVLTTHKEGWDEKQSPTAAAQTVNFTDPALPSFAARLNRELKPTYFLFYRRARAWIRQQIEAGVHFDLVHQINPLALRYPSPALGFGIPLVIGPLAGSLQTPEGFREESSDKQWYRKLRNLDSFRFQNDPWLRRTYSEAALLLGVAPYVQKALGSIPLKRFESIAETGVESVAQVKKEPRSKDAPLKLLFVGRIIRTKGVIDAIRAVSEVSKTHDVQFDIIGEGDHRAACEAEAKALGIEELVTFHGRLPREDLAAWYQKSDVFLFPSFREPSGNVVFEAMGHGLPVVTSSVGGPGFVVDDSCGILVEPTEPNKYARGLAEAVSRLASDPTLVLSLSNGAAKRIESVALWPKKIDSLMNHYHQLTRSSSASPAL